MNEFKLLDEVKPTTKGRYLVIWSNPYEKEPGYAIEYWANDRFIHQKAGANEVIMWTEFPEFPDISKELRTRRCK